jgi:hypothetical protein
MGWRNWVVWLTQRRSEVAVGGAAGGAAAGAAADYS